MIQTVDIHAHLLSSRVSFNRLYDKIALRFFGKRLGIRDTKKLFESPYETYTETLIQNIKESRYLTKTVLFGVDDRVDKRGKTVHSDTTVCASNDDLLSLYKQHPSEIIPFFSINPMRPDALDLIDKYVEEGFKGAKFLQNYWGVDTRESHYAPYFEKLAKYDIPLIVHIGSEGSIHSFKECERLEMVVHPLSCGVKVIAAHVALTYNLKKPFTVLSKHPKSFNEEYFALLSLLEKHKNLYSDISAILTPFRAKVLPHLSKQTHIHDKLLFGTDFPVPFTTLFSTYDLRYKKRLEIGKTLNPFDRYLLAIKEYFDEASPVYTNYKKILKQV